MNKTILCSLVVIFALPSIYFTLHGDDDSVVSPFHVNGGESRQIGFNSSDSNGRIVDDMALRAY